MSKKSKAADKTSKTEIYAERIYDILCSSTQRVTTRDLARMAGCSNDQVYLAIKFLRELLESQQDTSVSSVRKEGYLLAGNGGDEELKSLHLLIEATKSAERAFSHIARHSKLLSLVNRSLLQRPEHVELLSINVGASIASQLFTAYTDRLKSVAGPIAKKMLGDAKSEASAPYSNYGMKSFGDLMREARESQYEDFDY